jgi:hypothetical protein
VVRRDSSRVVKITAFETEPIDQPETAKNRMMENHIPPTARFEPVSVISPTQEKTS